MNIDIKDVTSVVCAGERGVPAVRAPGVVRAVRRGAARLPAVSRARAGARAGLPRLTTHVRTFPLYTNTLSHTKKYYHIIN